MRVTYSGPVVTGKDGEGIDTYGADLSTINKVLMVQSAQFTGSEGWDLDQALYAPEIPSSQRPCKKTDIVIPKGSQIVRLDLVVGVAFGGTSGGDALHVGIVYPDGETLIKGLAYKPVPGNIRGVANLWYHAHPIRWKNVGDKYWSSDGLTPSNKDGRITVQYAQTPYTVQVATWTTSNYWVTVSNPRVCTTVGGNATVTVETGGGSVSLGIAEGQTVTGSRVPADTTVASTSGSNITLSNAITGSGSVSGVDLEFGLNRTSGTNGFIGVGAPITNIVNARVCTTVGGNATVTLAPDARSVGILAGQAVTGSGVPADTTVSSVSGASVVLSNAITTSGTRTEVTLSFGANTAWEQGTFVTAVPATGNAFEVNKKPLTSQSVMTSNLALGDATQGQATINVYYLQDQNLSSY